LSEFIITAQKFIKSEDAPTMVEYGLLIALIALVGCEFNAAYERSSSATIPK